MLFSKKRLLSGVFVLVLITTSVPLFNDFNTSLNLRSDEVYADTLTYNDSIQYEVVDGTVVITGCNVSLTEIDIPALIDDMPVTKISATSFWRNSELEIVDIPASVTVIEDFTFASNLKLAEINVDKNNTSYSSISGVLFNKDATELIQFPIFNSAISYDIPSTVITIKSKAFLQNQLTKITFPVGLQNIGDAAFIESQYLQTLRLPSTVVKIGNYSFAKCQSLKSISVASGNTIFKSIDGVLYTANGKELIQYPTAMAVTSYDIPTGVTIIGKGAFANAVYLTQVTIPEGVVQIKESSFDTCSITSIILPSTLNTVGTCSFWGCSDLTKISFNSTIQEFGDAVFGLCINLKSIDIPYGVTFLGMGTFTNCINLEEVTLPVTLTGIDIGAFESCISLKTLDIPGNVDSISPLAINNCTSLTDIYITQYTSLFDMMCLGYIYTDDDNIVVNPLLTIHSYTGTAAEEYALSSNINFESLGEIPMPAGDLDRDGVISALEYKKLTVTILGQESIDGVSSITSKQASDADTNKDGILNVFDKIIVKKRVFDDKTSDNPVSTVETTGAVSTAETTETQSTTTIAETSSPLTPLKYHH